MRQKYFVVDKELFDFLNTYQTIIFPLGTVFAAFVSAFAAFISATASRTSARVAKSQRELAERRHWAHPST
jgi:hypothetical protein